jgi:Holliday junction resolvase-like predicted endonuclease
LRKQRQIVRAARAYRRLFGLVETSYRFDVITVTLAPVEAEGRWSKPRLELLKNFWTKDKFRKRRWHDRNFE